MADKKEIRKHYFTLYDVDEVMSHLKKIGIQVKLHIHDCSIGQVFSVQPIMETMGAEDFIRMKAYIEQYFKDYEVMVRWLSRDYLNFVV